MTELQFLLDLLLNHKLPKGTKALIADRVGEISKSMPQATAKANPGVVAQLQTSAPLAPPPANRIMGGEVSTGEGTRGPRKW